LGVSFQRYIRQGLSAIFLILSASLPVAPQKKSECYISPIRVNIQVGDHQPLQVLDGRTQELKASSWSVDNTELAEIKEESGHAMIYAKAVGVVHVVALVETTALTQEIKIWSVPPGARLAVHWVVPSTGRELGAVQAVATADGPDLFSVDQNATGTYLRAFTKYGLQMWSWLVPHSDDKIELLCADNMGGAAVTATRPDSYTFYLVGKDGKLRWRHKFEGVRKGYAFNTSNLVHLLNQSVDGTSAILSAWDGSTGAEKFELQLPSSYQEEANVQRSGNAFTCTPGRSVSHPLRIDTSGLIVNTDGDLYVVFTVKRWTIGMDKCTTASIVDARKAYFSRDDQLILWRVPSDGSHHSNVVDTAKQSRLSLTTPIDIASPTGEIFTDGLGGVLFSMRSITGTATGKRQEQSEEFIYRFTENGELAYKFPLPRYEGPLHDELILGENDLGFATRGGTLVAFHVPDGKEVWRWESGMSEVKVNMSTAGGGCLLDTPEGVILVEDGIEKQVVAPHGSEIYTPGVFVQDDPHGLAMIGAFGTPE
jgi:hypothetical protein